MIVGAFPSGGVLVTDNGSLQVETCELISNGVSTSNNAFGIEFNTTNGSINSVDNSLISGNYGNGIIVSGTPDVEIESDYIGTDINGTVDAGNTLDGIHVDGAAGMSIQGNVISGNDSDGIRILHVVAGDPGSIVDNYIGIDQFGTSALDNIGNGIDISSSTTTSQSTYFNVEGNTISANHGDGVDLTNLVTGTSVSLLGNLIGTDITGNAALGNLGNGIEIVNTVATSPTITIGDSFGHSENVT